MEKKKTKKKKMQGLSMANCPYLGIGGILLYKNIISLSYLQ